MPNETPEQVCDTEEAYSFEMSRVGKIFDLSLGEVKERCAAIATPFYDKALSSATAKWDTVKAGQLQGARKTLGMDEEKAKEMHKEVYRCVCVSGCVWVCGWVGVFFWLIEVAFGSVCIDRGKTAGLLGKRPGLFYLRSKGVVVFVCRFPCCWIRFRLRFLCVRACVSVCVC